MFDFGFFFSFGGVFLVCMYWFGLVWFGAGWVELVSVIWIFREHFLSSWFCMSNDTGR